jgi:hypothetical protein
MGLRDPVDYVEKRTLLALPEFEVHLLGRPTCSQSKLINFVSYFMELSKPAYT